MGDRLRAWGQPVILVVAGYVLLLASWAAAAAPFTVPDEMAHYIRVLGISTGDVVGEPGSYPPDESGPAAQARREWVNATTRSVEVPGGLSGLGLDCVPASPYAPASCLDDPAGPPIAERHHELTPVGTYQPLFYLLPGAVVGLGASPQDALGWARAASALTSAILLAVAVVSVWHGGRYGLALSGILLAVTPMALYLGASINTSGAETMATIAFAAVLLRLSRYAVSTGGSAGARAEVDRVPVRVWVAVGVLGGSVALSRSIGLVWVAILLILWLLWTGTGATRRLVAHNRRGFLLACVSALIGLGGSLAWQATYEPSPPAGSDGVRAAVASAWHQLDEVLRQAVGMFGALDTALPWSIDELWIGVAVVILAGGVVAAPGLRRRIAILAAVAAAVVVPMAFWVVSYRHTGFALQGRHFLPLFAVVPLLAGEGLGRFASRRVLRVATALVAVLAAVAHGVAWWWVARRYAVGIGGPAWFPPDAGWEPVLGWYPWVALTGLGCVLVAMGGIRAGRGDHHGQHRGTTA